MADDRKARYRDISDGLLRQRRNLLVISFLMPLFFLSGASIEKINLLGTLITVKKPEIVEYSIVVLFAYFFLRYWQYYKEETYIQDMYRRMKEHIYSLEIGYLNKKVREKVNFLNSEHVDFCFSDPKYSSLMGLQFVSIPENKDRFIFPCSQKCEFYIYHRNNHLGSISEGVESFYKKLSEQEKDNWIPLITKEGSNERPTFYRGYLTYNIFRFYLLRLAGMFRYLLNESYFTDYQLPFIVSVFSALVTTYFKFI